MSDIIQPTDTATVESANCSADPEKNLFCELRQGMLFSCGESSETPADKQESIARRSGMKERIAARNSFDRRMRLLIASGLVCGITPTSIRQQCGARIPDFVSSLPAGDGAVKLKAD